MAFRQSIKAIYKPLLTPGFFLAHILIPLTTLLFLLLLTAWLFPPGVNQNFATRTVRYLAPLLIPACLTFLALKVFQKNEPTQPDEESISVRDLLLLLLPLTPVVQYLLNNTSLLSWRDALLVLGLFLLISSFPVLILPLLFRKMAASRSVMVVGVAFTFLIANMASLSSHFTWHTTGSLKVLLPLLGILLGLLWLIFRQKWERAISLFAIIFFIGTSVVQLFVHQETTFAAPRSEQAEQAEMENPLFRTVSTHTPARTPNIYLLIYDAYPAPETLSTYGLDNRTQEAFLREKGFKLYPRTYSVAAYTVSSMSFVLNSALEYYGSDRRALAGNGVVQNILKTYGYTTYGIFTSDFFFWENEIPSYTYAFPRPETSMALLLTRAILEGEFRFDINFEKVSYDQYLQEKIRVLANSSANPRFVYSHSKLPGHSQNSGACLPNETELFAERLATANAEMRHDIEVIMENDPSGIIVVAGDHGPYLTKNCMNTHPLYDITEINRLDVQDRFGVLLAIRWPSPDFEVYDEITILQDLFPAIFAYMFEDKALLQTRLEPVTVEKAPVSGVIVVNGIIHGGLDDGEPLFPGTNGEH